MLCLSPRELTRLTGNSPHTPSPIHILDDDSLLNIFYLYRPATLDEDEDNDNRLYGGSGWDRERWWYKLAQVCQGWRSLILGSASYLDLCLFCTYGTPTTDMLAHSPHLPLVIDYVDPNHDIAAEEEEEGIILRSSSEVGFVASASTCLFRICRSSLWPSTGNTQCWNTCLCRFRKRTRVVRS